MNFVFFFFRRERITEYHRPSAADPENKVANSPISAIRRRFRVLRFSNIRNRPSGSLGFGVEIFSPFAVLRFRSKCIATERTASIFRRFPKLYLPSLG